MLAQRRYARVFILEDLPEETLQTFAGYLLSQGFGADFMGLFWLPVPASLLHDAFLEHEASCAPYRMSLEIDVNHVRLELLMRGSGTMSCTCTGYGSVEIETAMMRYLEQLLFESCSI